MSDPKWLFHGAMKQLAVSWGAMEVMEIWIFTGKWKGTNDESVVKRFFFWALSHRFAWFTWFLG